MTVKKELNNQAAQEFSTAFARCFSGVLSEALQSTVDLTTQDVPDQSALKRESIHFRVSVNGEDECFLEMYKPDVLMIGSKLLDDSDTEYGEKHAEAVLQLIAATLPDICMKLSASYASVKLSVDRVSDLVLDGKSVASLSGVGRGLQFTMSIYFGSRFRVALGMALQPESASKVRDLYANVGNFGLVMDVELSVTLRFGQRQMPLREVLELESGSVIELDRKVDAPVELLLDGKVVALGEAVIVEGNYGLRVTKVPHPIASQWNQEAEFE